MPDQHIRASVHHGACHAVGDSSALLRGKCLSWAKGCHSAPLITVGKEPGMGPVCPWGTPPRLWGWPSVLGHQALGIPRTSFWVSGDSPPCPVYVCAQGSGLHSCSCFSSVTYSVADSRHFNMSLVIFGASLKAPAPGVLALRGSLAFHFFFLKEVPSPANCGEKLENIPFPLPPPESESK